MPGKEIGIHGHNSRQLAFANTIEGIIKGTRAAMAFLKSVHGNTRSEFHDELLNVDNV